MIKLSELLEKAGERPEKWKEPNYKLFRVFESDDYGRPSQYLGVFKAMDDKEARQKAARHYSNKDIVTTGFYGTEEVTTQQLEKEKAELLKKIDDKTRIIWQK